LIVLDEVKHRVRMLEELVKARLEVDVTGLVAGIRARLESRLPLEALPIPSDLADRQGPFGWGRVRTWAWKAASFRKVALTHVSMRPVIEGFAVVLLPEEKRRAPVFACDLMALPTRISVNADVYGPPEERAAIQSMLQPLGESFVRLGTGSGPAWANPISSGVGLHAKPSPRMIEDAFAALTAALGRYFEVAQDAPEGPGGAELQKRFFELFHENGPRQGPLGRIFGADWAERYSRLIFE
jgi:hypothetical protein